MRRPPIAKGGSVSPPIWGGAQLPAATSPLPRDPAGGVTRPHRGSAPVHYPHRPHHRGHGGPRYIGPPATR